LKYHIHAQNLKIKEGVNIPYLNRFFLTAHQMMSILDSLEDFGARPDNCSVNTWEGKWAEQLCLIAM
jgi:hypothetical protein